MDHQLFADIYDAHARAVYAHAVRMTADRAGAEDAVSSPSSRHGGSATPSTPSPATVLDRLRQTP
ncbi:hypothetical protein [Streptomyces xanthophaeus]|uniref:hypothetical protein n=1 Tax=Streptomyces xanthophaeus TaxID=67385 RepID=UPI00233EAE95|nr:hypothetical protein [Streptomyces xanthophaeus]